MKPKDWQPSSPAADNPETNMEAYFKTLREPEYAGSFLKTAAWVRQQQYTASPAMPWWQTIRYYLFGSTFRIAYTFLFLIGLVAACNYPVEVNEPVASVLTWQVNAQDKGTVAAIAGLPWLKEEQQIAEEKVVDGTKVLEYTVTLPAVSKDQLQTYQQNLKQLAGVQRLLFLPVTHKTSQPLYEAALGTMLKIEMDVSAISDADLKQAVEAKLRQQGLTHIDIAIKQNAKGQRMITTQLPEKPQGNQNFDLLLKDGQRHTRIKEQKRLIPGPGAPNFKNMTDDQIKATIIRDHPGLPLHPENIKITRQAEDILISIDDEKGNKLKLRVK
jgi:hypothetical protein